MGRADVLFALAGVRCQQSQAFRALGRSRASPGPLGCFVALSNNWREAEGSQLQRRRGQGRLSLHRGCGVAAAIHALIAPSSCWLQLWDFPAVPILAHRGWAVPRSGAARTCGALRAAVCLGGCGASPPAPVTGMGWMGCGCSRAVPSGPAVSLGSRVPAAGMRTRCRAPSALRAVPAGRGEPGGVGHSADNPREAAKVGRRCLLPGELAGWDTELRERWERRCSLRGCRAAPSASSGDASASSLSLDLACGGIQQRSQRGSQRAQGGAGACGQRWSEWERSPCWSDQ